MPQKKRTFLIVEPEAENRKFLEQAILESCSARVEVAQDPSSAFKILDHVDVHVLVTSLFPPEKQGLNLIEEIAAKGISLTPIVCIPSGDRESVIQALSSGAQYYINTPLQKEEVAIIARRALQASEQQIEQFEKIQELRKTDGFHGIVGGTQEMNKLFNLIEKIAEEGNSTVLIQGESGAGKELVAQAIHENSPRKDQNLVPVNCAAIPEELLESELFGYVKGAFTGANQSKQGRVHYAHKGTLFMDEIGDMSPSLQAKLLRVLQEQEVEPVGSVKPSKVDVRVLAATRCDLEEKVREGTFREDLFYRLSVIPVRVPPLRERKEDIPLLLDKFISLYKRNQKGKLKSFSSEAIETLKQYSWPGNVRELKNLVQRLSILQETEVVDMEDLPEKILEASNMEDSPPSDQFNLRVETAEELDFNSQISEFEDRLILQALISSNGNKKQAARNLNLKRTTLLEKIKKKNLDQVYSQYIQS